MTSMTKRRIRTGGNELCDEAGGVEVNGVCCSTSLKIDGYYGIANRYANDDGEVFSHAYHSALLKSGLYTFISSYLLF